MKKLIALLLCAAMLLSLAACTPSPAEPTTVPTTVPTEPQAQDIYAQACDALDGLSDVTLELVVTTLVTVDGDEFSERSTQTLTYGARGTEEAVIVMEESLEFSVHSEDASSDDDDSEPTLYKEICYQNTVYAELDETYRFRGPVEADAAALRYTPVVLLDSGLYGTITSEPAENGTLIRFDQPTAGESWAVPQNSELVEASGTALLDAEGKLTQMDYTVTYEYGPSLVTVTVQSKPLDTAKTAAAPENSSSYTPIDCIDAVSINIRSLYNLFQADSLTFNSTESIFCEAAAVMWSYSYQVDMHGRKKNTIAKIDTSGYFMDYSENDMEEYEREETYRNNKLTTVINDGLPSSESFSWEDVRAYTADILMAGITDFGDWENVTATDMGSVYYLEFQLSENFGNSMQNYIVDSLWDDPSFLVKLASKYENTELTGYYSIDKYTGLPVAFGYYYKGVHTIDGYDYEMWMQVDESIEAPAKGAYKEITDELPAEEEPENKATPLFYHVTGEDGQEMWLFGTIHVGDARTAYLPQEIYDAFVNSDALALECNTEAFDEQLEQDEKLAEQVSDLYFYADGKEGIKESMDEEDYAYAQKLLKAVGGNGINMPYVKPYVWSNVIEMFYLRQGYQLHSDQGVEERLMDWAQELDKEILEIESSLFQIKMLTGFSNDLQIWMLEDAMDTDGREYWENTWALYELWCAGDEEALRAEISEEWDYSELTEEEVAKYKPLMEEYEKAMSIDRNEGMLDAAISYLESDRVIFYAVGLAHLLDGTNGLVDALREAGYTVELVEFAG